MMWSRLTWGQMTRSGPSLSMSWECGKDSWSAFPIQPVSEEPPRWQALHPISSWLDSWKGNFYYVISELILIQKGPWHQTFCPSQLLSRLWSYQLWLLVCVCFPAHACLPGLGMDMDLIFLRGIEHKVMRCLLLCWTDIIVVLEDTQLCKQPVLSLNVISVIWVNDHFVSHFPNLFFFSLRLCLRKHDRRAQAEAKAQALIEEDYKKLGPLKWGLVYVFKCHAVDFEWVHVHHRAFDSILLCMLHFSFAEGSISFFFILFAILLFTRDPKFVTGWSVLFKKG